MKKVYLLLLAVTVALCGCGRREETAVRTLQSRWANMEQLTMEAEILCHSAGESRGFTVVSTCTLRDGTTTVTAPEEIAGLSATVSGEELLLRWDGAALSAGISPVLSPAACVPYLARSVAEGYLLEYGTEMLDGMNCIRAAFDTTAPDGGKILCTVWFEAETGAPRYAEFSADGAVVLTVRTLRVEMKEKEG